MQAVAVARLAMRGRSASSSLFVFILIEMNWGGVAGTRESGLAWASGPGQTGFLS